MRLLPWATLRRDREQEKQFHLQVLTVCYAYDKIYICAHHYPYAHHAMHSAHYVTVELRN
jgi:hypothetical protein